MLAARREFTVHGHAEAATAMNDTLLAWLGRRTPEERATVWYRDYRGRALAFAGRYAEALVLAEAILDSLPKNPVVHTFIGIWAVAVGDTARAMEQALWISENINPNSGGLDETRYAWLLRALGRNEEAYQALLAALDGRVYHMQIHDGFDPAWPEEDPRVAALLRLAREP